MAGARLIKRDPIAAPLSAKVRAAALAAIDDTTAAAAISAKSSHGWRNITGAAEGSIQMRPAVQTGPRRFRGEFGSYGVIYFIWLELGHHVLSRRGFQYSGGDPANAFGKFVQGDHTLRRAADSTFPTLGARLKARLG